MNLATSSCSIHSGEKEEEEQQQQQGQSDYVLRSQNGTESWSRHVEVDVDDNVPVLSSNAPSLLADDVLDHDDDDDEDEDDDEDNWSRKVETDDIQRMPSSITGDGTALDVDDDNSSAVMLHHSGDVVIPPRREEHTLKERLVERERQRRVESERARWKRQFVMAAHTEGDDEDTFEGGVVVHHQGDPNIPQNGDHFYGDGGLAIRETNSVAGTVGEDTVALIETLEDEGTKMNYPMERFLQEQENSLQQEAEIKKDTPRDSMSNQGVVMERFLQEPPVVIVHDEAGTPSHHEMSILTSVQRSVSFDTDLVAAPVRDFLNLSTASSSFADASTDHARIPGGMIDAPQGCSLPLQVVHSAPGSVANVSTTCLPPSDDDRDQDEVPMEIPAVPESSQEETTPFRDGLPIAPIVDFSGVTGVLDLQDEPESPSPHRVLRLTEAEIQEMTAIDEVSRSNAPPSERDDMSELGELVGDFGGPVLMDHPNNSQGTPTTAMESLSSVANRSGFVLPTTDDQLSIDALGTASVSSHNVTSSVGGDTSIAANPPSDIGVDDDDDDEDGRGPRDVLVSSEVIPVSPPPIVLQEPTQGRPVVTSLPQVESKSLFAKTYNGDNDAIDQYAADETIVNRIVRPGLFNYNLNLRDDMQNMPHKPSARLKKASSFPNHVISSFGSGHIEGFDFDKNDYSPFCDEGTSDMLLRNDMWSSGLSPTNQGHMSEDGPSIPILPDYGTRAAAYDGESKRFASGRNTNDSETRDGDDEQRPLLDTVPGEVTTRRRSSNFALLTSTRSLQDLNLLAESIFSDVRSEGTSTVQSVTNEAQEYLNSSIWHRAFPERLFALTVTLLFEIPVLLMVSGGSDRLCYLIGRTKYQLLLGFLPLSSAISGNVGLQASTLTTRAISHGQVAVENYKTWLSKEIGAATYLGKSRSHVRD
jgi:hypothetical protein